MKEIKVGTYPLGDINVEVYGLIGGRCGELEFRPADLQLPRIKVGFNFQQWVNVYDILLHESLEFLLIQQNCTFKTYGEWSHDSSARTFMFDHIKFNEIIARQSWFLCAVQTDLKKLWLKHHNEE